jgi:ATP-dependent DNA helicase RecG
MDEMKRVYEALEAKVGSLEEGEHAEHIDQKAVKQMRKDIAALRKAEEKLRKEFDKKFSGKEKKETPAKEKATQALQEGFDLITDAFPSPQYQVSMVHGKLKPAEKDAEMQRFVRAETQIMVATTVIEVGVNVPNASVMVIESAERFGLSQLHQLRGRVGRGAEKSYCILMTGEKLSKESMKRMETMVMTNDGFQISEVDLQLRGPGDLMGTQQSGVLNLKLADLSRDGQIVSLAREKAREILENDPDLLLQENSTLNQRMRQVLKSRPNWGRIA